MATTVRGGGGGGTSSGRESRGKYTLPSSSPFLNTSPKPSSFTTPTSPSSSRSLREKNNPVLARKQVPGYLRSTNNAKTLGPESPARKSAPSRRKPIDPPPPATAKVQRPSQGPLGARVTKPVRSSSLSNRTSTSSSRVVPERRTSVGKPLVKERKVEPQLSKTRSLNRGTLASKPTPKGSSRFVSKNKSSKSLVSEPRNESRDDCDNDNQVIEHLVSDDDMTYTHLGSLSLPEISEMPISNEELGDPTNLEVMGNPVSDEDDRHHDHHDGNDQKDVDDQDQELTEEPIPEEIKAQMKEEEDGEEKIIVEEALDDDQPEVQSGEQGDHDGESVRDHDGAHQTLPEVDPIETFPEKEESEKEEEENVGVEVEKQSSPPSVAAPAVVCVAVKKSQSQPAEKKESQAYNDVIEQTASRLMGKKNKVLALAGAFETVISYANKN